MLIADDHAVYRAGLSMLLKADTSITVFEASTRDEAFAKLAQAAPAAAIFDLDMPGMCGPSSLLSVRESNPGCKIIVLSALADDDTVSLCKSAGCICHIDKAAPLSDTLRQIRNALELPQSMTDKSLVNPTARQREVLRLVANGMTNKEIARDLGVAPGTVKIHLAALLALFGVRNRVQLLACWAAIANISH